MASKDVLYYLSSLARYSEKEGTLSLGVVRSGILQRNWDSFYAAGGHKIGRYWRPKREL